jgi:hypothetical protein
VLDWLLTPMSGATVHQLPAWAAWHARVMVLAWGFLLPLGALAARYFKVTPHQDWPRVLDNKAWWHAHRGLQWAGVAAMGVGAWLAWGRGAGTGWLAAAHAWGGWSLLALCGLQLAGGLARGSKGGPTDVRMRGDHYDMTPWRLRFERLHKALGWLAVAAAVAVIVLGLAAADAPRWMLAALSAWWVGLVLAATVWQRRGRCVDTYQAIWGPDPAHPGNRARPLGWGVRRPLDPAEGTGTGTGTGAGAGTRTSPGTRNAERTDTRISHG